MNQMTPAFTIQALYTKILIVLFFVLSPCMAMATEYFVTPKNFNGAGNICFSATKTQGLTLELAITVTGQR
ncbi:MAG: hypothetical protein PVJ39_08125 [Gammaproteobacteria bacterium]|jgi:hypothetical protein